ncbi:glycoside hydrolase family 43 protein [Lentinus tigrinus ALCF2SS1-7]|uniref:Arabinan endo-1,5-alpha-L-arabinosidase n=1 Tax=Lentinus tigrinus ALCF2SS1-6 TaxID=1328759 RepID=A0A5C2S7L8_9APHY|nr:glycoside hydrolase family 43 protein [Lentinus tigrinus ALCF2SS1-6]RPD73544.1 glycoside hydrolase family 43 protein [Lentinus tigrinus ALCF2SS1-7]
MVELLTKPLAASLLALLFTLTLSVPHPLPGSENIIVRDPALWYNADAKQYSVFSTGGTIETYTSSSLNGPWNDAGMALRNCSKIQKPGNCSLWAPDVNFVNGTYVLYYAVSTGGSPNSAIGVATSPTMDPGSWQDLRELISSNNGTDYNAIDANLIDADGLQLTFGSYHQGIFQLPLSDIHSLKDAKPPGTHLAGGDGQPTEGAFIYKPQDSKFFYLFFSHGVTPLLNDPTRPPPGQEYRVLVGRSENVSGPFVDKDGHALTEVRDPPAGTLVLGTHDNIYAPGGQSVFRDPVSDLDVIVYHYVRKNEKPGGYSYLGINYLDFSSGWPAVVEK